MKRFADLIDLWPKPSNVTLAADLGLPASTVRVMRYRNAVAPKYFPAIVASASKHAIAGVTLEALFAIAARPAGQVTVLPAEGATANA